MKTFQINTTQNVNINFTLANFGQRLLAFFVDNIIKFAYIYLIIEFFDFGLIDSALEGDHWSIKAIDVLIFLPITFYSLYSEILMNGQTLGKKLIKIRVTNIDGFKPSTMDYIIRWFLRIVDFNFFSLIFIYWASLGLGDYYFLIFMVFVMGKGVGGIFILATTNSQRVGDLAANTIVIYLKDTVEFSHTILEEIADTYKPTYPNVIKLSDNDARIIKGTFKTAAKAGDYKTLIKLRKKIEEVTGIKSKSQSDTAFIDTVLKDYNYYTQDM